VNVLISKVVGLTAAALTTLQKTRTTTPNIIY
jgi:hypothetical protein